MPRNFRPMIELICDWTQENNCYTQYRSSIFHVEKGMKVWKQNERMKFKRKKWLKPYIDLNNDLRSKAESKFKESICGSINNKFSGIFENVRLRRRKITAKT